MVIRPENGVGKFITRWQLVKAQAQKMAATLTVCQRVGQCMRYAHP